MHRMSLAKCQYDEKLDRVAKNRGENQGMNKSWRVSKTASKYGQVSQEEKTLVG